MKLLSSVLRVAALVPVIVAGNSSYPLINLGTCPLKSHVSRTNVVAGSSKVIVSLVFRSQGRVPAGSSVLVDLQVPKGLILIKDHKMPVRQRAEGLLITYSADHDFTKPQLLQLTFAVSSCVALWTTLTVSGSLYLLDGNQHLYRQTNVPGSVKLTVNKQANMAKFTCCTPPLTSAPTTSPTNAPVSNITINGYDICHVMAFIYRITFEDLLTLNPDLDGGCTNLQLGQRLFVCTRGDGTACEVALSSQVLSLYVQTLTNMSSSELQRLNPGVDTLMLDLKQVVNVSCKDAIGANVMALMNAHGSLMMAPPPERRLAAVTTSKGVFMYYIGAYVSDNFSPPTFISSQDEPVECHQTKGLPAPRLSDLPLLVMGTNYLLLAFARGGESCARIKGNPSNFQACWDTNNLTPTKIRDFKQNSPRNVKFLVSIAGDRQIWVDPSNDPGCQQWSSSASTSILKLISDYELDGVDINYERFDDGFSMFTTCIGKVIKSIKDRNSAFKVSVAPYGYSDYDNMMAYKTLIQSQSYGSFVDYINYQPYFDTFTTPARYLEQYRSVNDFFGGNVMNKMLLGFSSSVTTKSWNICPRPGQRGTIDPEILGNTMQLLAENGAIGAFVWTAEYSHQALNPAELVSTMRAPYAIEKAVQPRIIEQSVPPYGYQYGLAWKCSCGASMGKIQKPCDRCQISLPSPPSSGISSNRQVHKGKAIISIVMLFFYFYFF